jgi:hypothetical protein
MSIADEAKHVSIVLEWKRRILTSFSTSQLSQNGTAGIVQKRTECFNSTLALFEIAGDWKMTIAVAQYICGKVRKSQPEQPKELEQYLQYKNRLGKPESRRAREREGRKARGPESE